MGGRNVGGYIEKQRLNEQQQENEITVVYRNGNGDGQFDLYIQRHYVMKSLLI